MIDIEKARKKYEKLSDGLTFNPARITQETLWNLYPETQPSYLKEKAVPNIPKLNTPLATPKKIRTDMPDDYLVEPADNRRINSSDTTYFVNLPNQSGQYTTDLRDHQGLIQSVRKDGYEERKKILGDLSSVGFQIDHIVPISLGGSDNAENKQILTTRDHIKKTKVGAVARALYYGNVIDRAEAVSMAVNWRDKRVDDIELGDKGELDLKTALKERNKWKKPPKITFGDFWNSVKDTLKKGVNKIDDTIEDTIAYVTPENYLGDFADGLAEGLSFGYITPDSRKYKNEHEKKIADRWKVGGNIVGDLGSFMTLETALTAANPFTGGASGTVGLGLLGKKGFSLFKKGEKITKATKEAMSSMKTTKKITKAFSKGVLTNPRFFWHRFMQNAITGGVYGQLVKHVKDDNTFDKRLNELKNDIILYGAVPSLFKLSAKKPAIKTVNELISRVGETGKKATGVFATSYIASSILGNDYKQAFQDAAFLTAFHGIESKLSEKAVEKENTRVSQGLRRLYGGKAGMPEDKLPFTTLEERLKKENEIIKKKILEKYDTPEKVKEEYRKVLLAGHQIFKGGMGENTKLISDLADAISIKKKMENITPAEINNTTQQIQDGIEALNEIKRNKKQFKITKADKESKMVNRLGQATGISSDVNTKTNQSLKDYIAKGGGEEGDKIIITRRDDMEAFMKIKDPEHLSGNHKNNLHITGSIDGKKYDLGWVPSEKNLKKQVITIKNKFNGSAKTPNLDPFFNKDTLAELMEDEGLEYVTATVKKSNLSAKISGQPYITYKITPENLAESRKIKNNLKKTAREKIIKNETKILNTKPSMNSIYLDDFYLKKTEENKASLDILKSINNIYKGGADIFIKYLQKLTENTLTDNFAKIIRRKIKEENFSVHDLREILNVFNEEELLSSFGANHFKIFDTLYNSLSNAQKIKLDNSLFRINKNIKEASGEINQKIRLKNTVKNKRTLIKANTTVKNLKDSKGKLFNKEIKINRVFKIDDNTFKIISTDNNNKNFTYIVDRNGNSKNKTYSIDNFYVEPKKEIKKNYKESKTKFQKTNMVKKDETHVDVMFNKNIKKEIKKNTKTDIIKKETENFSLQKKEIKKLKENNVNKIISPDTKEQTYNKKDNVAVITKGYSADFNKKELKKAVKKKANITLTADAEKRTNTYNLGQKEVADFLSKKGYYELYPGEFVHIDNLSERQRYLAIQDGYSNKKFLTPEEITTLPGKAKKSKLNLKEEKINVKENEKISLYRQLRTKGEQEIINANDSASNIKKFKERTNDTLNEITRSAERISEKNKVLTKTEINEEVKRLKKDLISFSKEQGLYSYGPTLTENYINKGFSKKEAKSRVTKDLNDLFDSLYSNIDYRKMKKGEINRYVYDELFGHNAKKVRITNLNKLSQNESIEKLGELELPTIKEKEKLFGKNYSENKNLKAFFEKKPLTIIQEELFDKDYSKELELLFGKNYNKNEDLQKFFKYDGSTKKITKEAERLTNKSVCKKIKTLANSKKVSPSRVYNEVLDNFFTHVFGTTYEDTPNIYKTFKLISKKVIDPKKNRQNKDVLEKMATRWKFSGEKMNKKEEEKIFGKRKDITFINKEERLSQKNIDQANKNYSKTLIKAGVEGDAKNSHGINVRKLENSIDDISYIDNLHLNALVANTGKNNYEPRKIAEDARRVVVDFIKTYNRIKGVKKKISIQPSVLDKIIEKTINNNTLLKIKKPNIEENKNIRELISDKITSLLSENKISPEKFKEKIIKRTKEESLNGTIEDNMFKRYEKIKNNKKNNKNNLIKLKNKIEENKTKLKKETSEKELKILENNLDKISKGKIKGKEKDKVINEAVNFITKLTNVNKYIPMLLLLFAVMNRETKN